MASADYAHCDGEPCLKPNGSTKVFYDAETDVPTGTVILHAECAEARQAAAERRGYERARVEDIAALRDRKQWTGWTLSGVIVLSERLRRTPFMNEIAAEYLESLPVPAVASSLVKGDET